MNLIETIIAIILLILIVMTAINEPVSSFNYAKALVGNGVKLYNWCIDFIQQLKVNYIKENNNETINMSELPTQG